MTAVLLAVLLAAAAGWLSCRPPVAGSSPWRALGVAALAAVGVAAFRLGSVPRAGLLVVGLGALLGGANLLRRRAARAARDRVRRAAAEGCGLLAAELRAGAEPGTALGRVADEVDLFEQAREAFVLGGDVAGALRRTASGGGAEQLTLVAAGWELAARSGAGLADVVERIAAALRAGEETRRVVEGELASARATARLVALLPVGALGIGAGAGGDPVGFLLGTVPGSVCLGAGLLLAWVGLRWIDALCEPE